MGKEREEQEDEYAWMARQIAESERYKRESKPIFGHYIGYVIKKGKKERFISHRYSEQDWLESFVRKFENVSGLKVEKSGFCGYCNGGFKSRVIRDHSEPENILLRKCYYCASFKKNIYLNINAIDVLQKVLSRNVLEYAGEDFDFLSQLDYELQDTFTEARQRYYKLIKKDEIESGKILRSKAIAIAIGWIKVKVKVYSKKRLW